MDFMRRALSLSKSFAQASSCSISHVRHGVSSSARGGGVSWPFLGRLSTPFPPFFLSRRNLSFASGPPFLQSSQMPIKIYNASCRQFATRNLHGRLFYKRRPKMIPKWSFNPRSKWLEGAGNRKGVCTKVFITSPKKPNSGQRKVCYVRLSNGRIVKAYIPGMGHNLQVHSVVMVRGGRRREIIGCNYTCMRGQYDLLPVKNRGSKRSKYAIKRPNTEPNRLRWKQDKHTANQTTIVDRRLHFHRTGEWVDDSVNLHADRFLPPRGPSITRRHAISKQK
ncbi:unnamed protein product [Cladocopium goreaui]|uniref:37S ribosomal protein S12, mitochondrial n=1 Tax=Cladocopium goreaui TaxID=2562237 RepID=A0A9P1DR91_9DINO|nr:unnamed protein product [Cladocopium goreaui]